MTDSSNPSSARPHDQAPSDAPDDSAPGGLFADEIAERPDGLAVEASSPISATDLFPLVYDKLRAVARARLQSERSGHTLQATALVHEVYFRLAGERRAPWQGTGHFFAAAAEAMRRILLDHAKARGRQKRGGGMRRSPIDVLDLAALPDGDEILALDEALCRLKERNPQAHDVVMLRFFAGLSVDETAAALETSPRTVDRRWKLARAWLFRELQGPKTDPNLEPQA